MSAPAAAASSWSANNAFLKGGPEVLIKEVFARRPIWDLRSHAHHNRELVCRLWEEISELLGVPTDTVKTKWKHLRDNFRTELKKTVRGMGDPPRPYQSQWTYFNDLLFLEEQMMRKMSHTYGSPPQMPYGVANGETTSLICMGTNVSDVLTADDENLMEKHQSIMLGHSLFDDSSMHEQFAIWAQQPEEELPRKRKRRCDAGTEPPEEKPKVNGHCSVQTADEQPTAATDQSVIDTNTDDDFHFMMSLLPYVRSLSLSKKMHLRLKFQELICDFIYNIKVPAANAPPRNETRNGLKTTPPNETPERTSGREVKEEKEEEEEEEGERGKEKCRIANGPVAKKVLMKDQSTQETETSCE